MHTQGLNSYQFATGKSNTCFFKGYCQIAIKPLHVDSDVVLHFIDNNNDAFASLGVPSSFLKFNGDMYPIQSIPARSTILFRLDLVHSSLQRLLLLSLKNDFYCGESPYIYIYIVIFQRFHLLHPHLQYRDIRSCRLKRGIILILKSSP